MPLSLPYTEWQTLPYTRSHWHTHGTSVLLQEPGSSWHQPGFPAAVKGLVLPEHEFRQHKTQISIWTIKYIGGFVLQFAGWIFKSRQWTLPVLNPSYSEMVPCFLNSEILHLYSRSLLWRLNCALYWNPMAGILNIIFFFQNQLQGSPIWIGWLGRRVPPFPILIPQYNTNQCWFPNINCPSPPSANCNKGKFKGTIFCP